MSIYLAGPTLADGLADLLPPNTKGADVSGDRELHHQDQDRNQAACTCEFIVVRDMAVISCPNHLPKQYAKNAQHVRKATA